MTPHINRLGRSLLEGSGLEGLGTDPSEKRPFARLEAFSHFQVEEIARRLEAVRSPSWPDIKGCFVILFTARSGSTFACRELECVFDIGRMGESLNPAQVKSRPATEIIRARENRWFAFKAGMQGVIAAEMSGVFDAYLAKTVFIRLIRRDIVAQAVSYVRAVQTSQWHLTDNVRNEPHYDAQAITKAVRKLSDGIRQLGVYAAGARRPCLTLVYEDISQGDVTLAIAAGDSLGLPRLPQNARLRPRPAARMSDELNVEWSERYLRHVKPTVGKCIEAHEAAVEIAGSALPRV